MNIKETLENELLSMYMDLKTGKATYRQTVLKIQRRIDHYLIELPVYNELLEPIKGT